MDQDCSICLAKLNPAKKNISATQCGHLFHSDCIKRAIQVKPECPICKTNISGGIVNKLYLEVDKELANETQKKKDDIVEREKETRKMWLNIIKDYEKKNMQLKEEKKELMNKNSSLENELALAN